MLTLVYMGTWDRRHSLLLATILLHFLVLVVSPVLHQPPRLKFQRDAVIKNAIIACIPLLWSFGLTIFGRSRFTTVLAALNIPAAIVWLMGAAQMLAKAFDL